MTTVSARNAEPARAWQSRSTVPGGLPKDSILDCVGGTPLVRLEGLIAVPDVELYAKLEGLNPGGSAKDRPALAMMEAARLRGDLRPGCLVVESSSGNTAIGLAQYCCVHGLRFCCVVDPAASPLNLKVLKSFGATIVRVERPDESGDFLGARLRRVREILAREANAFWPNQYENPANPQAHVDGTAEEVDRQLPAGVDWVAVATSTTGTIQGFARVFADRPTRIVAVDAEGSALFGGRSEPRSIPGLGAGRVPRLAEGFTPDALVRVSALDCVVGCRLLARRHGILVGGSAGGVVQALRRHVARELEPEAVCVAVLVDRGDRYLDTIYDDEWVEHNLGIGVDALEQMVSSESAGSPDRGGPRALSRSRRRGR